MKIRGPAGSTANARRVQRAFGSPLAPTVQQYLIDHDGGEIGPHRFFTTDGEEAYVLRFRSCGDALERRDWIRDRIGDAFLPIADLEFGDYVCVEVATGRVAIWYHEEHGTQELCQSIPEFLDLLEPVSADYWYEKAGDQSDAEVTIHDQALFEELLRKDREKRTQE